MLHYLEANQLDKNRIKISLLVLLYMIILDVIWMLIFRYDVLKKRKYVFFINL